MYFESVDLESNIKKHIYSKYLNELNLYINDVEDKLGPNIQNKQKNNKKEFILIQKYFNIFSTQTKKA